MVFGGSWAVLGRFGSVLGGSWAVLVASWGPLWGPMWGARLLAKFVFFDLWIFGSLDLLKFGSLDFRQFGSLKVWSFPHDVD